MMRRAKVFVQGHLAGHLEEIEKNRLYRFCYVSGYTGPAVSLTLPTTIASYEFSSFPSFFDGLLPEGMQLEAVLKQAKIDRDDLFKQLVTVGQDLIGYVTLEE